MGWPSERKERAEMAEGEEVGFNRSVYQGLVGGVRDGEEGEDGGVERC